MIDEKIWYQSPREGNFLGEGKPGLYTLTKELLSHALSSDPLFSES